MDLRAVWEKRDNESQKDYELFLIWLEIPVFFRNLDSIAKVTDRLPTEIKKIKKRNDWDIRTIAYDENKTEREIETRRVKQESVRTVLFDEVSTAIKTIRSIMRGKLPKGADIDRKTKRPMVKADSLLSASWGVLDRCGVTVPKRLELAGLDDSELKIQLIDEMGSSMGVDELKDLIHKLGGTRGSAPPRKALESMGEDTGDEP